MTEKRSADYIAGLRRAAEIAREYANAAFHKGRDEQLIGNADTSRVLATRFASLTTIATAIEREAEDG